MRWPARSRHALCLVGLVAIFMGMARGGADAGQEPAPGSAEAFLKQVEQALSAAREPAADPRGAPPTPPHAGAPVQSPPLVQAPASRPSAPQGRLGYFELLPGQSTKADVELFLGDPVATRDGLMTYEPPPQAAEADRVEVTYRGDRRTLALLDVFLRAPLPYGDLAARAGRRVLVERDGAGRVWEYRVPSLLALGYPESRGGPPLGVDRLRYADPRHVADLFVARGRRAEGEGRPEDALVEFEKATRIDPTYAGPYLHMGRVLEARGERARALVHYAAATQAAYPRDLKAEAHVAVGRVHHADGQGELALRALDLAAAEDPGNVQAHFLAGLTYQKLLKRPRDAMAAYRRAVALRADHAAAHYNLGLVHLDQKEMRAAAEALERAVKARPGWDKASDRLLSVRLALGDFAAAEREARRRLDGAGEDAAAMISLAMALSSQLPERPTLLAVLASLVNEDPRLAEALQWLERAVARGYRDVVTLEQNPHLRQVRDQAPLAFREILARAAARARP